MGKAEAITFLRASSTDWGPNPYYRREEAAAILNRDYNCAAQRLLG